MQETTLQKREAQAHTCMPSGWIHAGPRMPPRHFSEQSGTAARSPGFSRSAITSFVLEAQHRLLLRSAETTMYKQASLPHGAKTRHHDSTHL